MLEKLGARSLVFALLLVGSLASKARADDMAAAIYVRGDTDHTTVVSPRARVSQSFREATRVDVVYQADVWTSASVDVRASASVRPIWEQRDELNLNLSHAWDLTKLHAGYRVSLEPDYLSHGFNVGMSQDLANKAATLDVNLRVLSDTVGRAASPEFSRGVATYTGNVSFTQILDPVMLMQLSYELSHLRGYQASPYRFVGIGPGATGFGCRGATVCLPEFVPHVRSRHALSAMLRRAFGNYVSLGLTYRFYIDDWALTSHTGLVELGFNVAEGTLLSLRYRVYRQGSVDFYQKRYLEEDVQNSYRGYRTRDKELSSLTYHRIGLELENTLWRGEHAKSLMGSLSVAGNRYHYAQFAGLESVLALEVSASLLLEL